MDDHDLLAIRIADEQDDVLSAIQLVDGDDVLSDRLFDQLVDLLVEGMFLDVRDEFLSGSIDRDRCAELTSTLAGRCRQQGLLPLPSRNS